MLQLIRRSTLSTLRQELAAAQVRADEAQQSADRAAELRSQDQALVTDLCQQLGEARTDALRGSVELETARAQVLLDAEDRVALRMLLQTARKQARGADRVHVLFQFGRLHSLHPTADAAEEAAEAEGAPRDGWTALAPGAAVPPASELPWRIQQMSLGKKPHSS